MAVDQSWMLRGIDPLNERTEGSPSQVHWCFWRYLFKIMKGSSRPTHADSAICSHESEEESSVTLFEIYNDVLRRLADEFAPVKTITVRQHPIAVWFDDECLKLRRCSRMLEKRYRRTKTSEDCLEWVQQERERHRIYRVKESSYWLACISNNAGQSRKLWKTFSSIMGIDQVSNTTLESPSAQDLLDFFIKKVADIRKSTGCSDPTTRLPPSSSRFDCFRAYAVEEVRKLMMSTKPKSCSLDPIPTTILFEFMDDVLPFITSMCNKSLLEGQLPLDQLPLSQRHALVTPILKKDGLDATSFQNYRPISNLTYISKLVERMVCQQLTGFLNESGLLAAKAPIWISSTTFDRNSDAEGPVWCPGCSRSTRGDPFGAAWYVGGVRYRWPLHPPTTGRGFVWIIRNCALVADIVPRWPYATGGLQWRDFISGKNHFRRSSRECPWTAPVSSLHGGCSIDRLRVWTRSALLRRRRSTLSVRECRVFGNVGIGDRRLYRRDGSMDVVQSPQTQPGQDPDSSGWVVANSFSRSKSIPFSTWLRFGSAQVVSQQPWSDLRQSTIHAWACSPCLSFELLPAASASCCSRVTHLWGIGPARACLHQQQTGLLQQSACRGKWPADRSASISSTSGSTVGSPEEEVRPHLRWHSKQITLASDSAANFV